MGCGGNLKAQAGQSCLPTDQRPTLRVGQFKSAIRAIARQLRRHARRLATPLCAGSASAPAPLGERTARERALGRSCSPRRHDGFPGRSSRPRQWTSTPSTAMTGIAYARRRRTQRNPNSVWWSRSRDPYAIVSQRLVRASPIVPQHILAMPPNLPPSSSYDVTESRRRRDLLPASPIIRRSASRPRGGKRPAADPSLVISYGFTGLPTHPGVEGCARHASRRLRQQRSDQL